MKCAHNVKMAIVTKGVRMNIMFMANSVGATQKVSSFCITLITK